MIINQFKIQQFRNLATRDFDFVDGFNVFFGPNGCGKTSIVEALYFLSNGRSFRTSVLKRIICHGKNDFTLFAKLTDEYDVLAGLMRTQDGEAKTRLDGKNITSHAQIARIFPTLLFNPGSFSILMGGSQERRRLLDWGVFHAKEEFLRLWQSARSILKQRSAALKSKQTQKLIYPWNEQLVIVADKMDGMRQGYIDEFAKILNKLLTEFLPDYQDIVLQYYRGWPRDENLADSLNRAFEHDYRLGFTSYGPHRADLRLKINGVLVRDILSRGQQKLLICAMKIAQGILFEKHRQKQCIYLLDDIASELDETNCQILLKRLKLLESQVFVTSIHNDFMVKYLSDKNCKNFSLVN